MRFLERLSAGAACSLLSLSSQTFHDTQDLLDHMQKYVVSDCCMHGPCVDFENRRLHISDTRKLWIVVSLTAAYNNSLTAQQLQYEMDLYGKVYTPGEESGAQHKAV
jgi:hypothetical protein